MAPYNYNNYYDPVGSQSTQPQGYTYAGNQQQSTPTTNNQYPSQTNSSYQTGYSQNYNTAYGNQYGSSAQSQPQASSTTNRAASAVNTMNNSQNYAQSSSDNRTSNTQYDSSYYSSQGFAAMNSRSQANDSPVYATNSGDASFGRLSLPQSQTNSNPFGTSQSYQTTTSNASTHTYQNAPSSAKYSSRPHQTAYTQSQTQSQPPQRYASPLHAVQAQQHQQGHAKQASRTSNHAPSPQMAARNSQQQHLQQQRQASASVEPSPTTVDPSQVYDMRAEQQRKAQVEAEKRRKAEAHRKAEEQARAAEEAARKAEEDRKAESERVEREAREAEEKAKADEEAAKKRAAQDRKNEQRRKAREEKRQSKTAATALTQMASSSSAGNSAEAAMAAMAGDMSQPPANPEEAEMRAMFKKMREFNARNPAMLAKLWEEERTAHAAQTTATPPANTAQAPPPPKQQSAKAQNTASVGTPKTNSQVRPFAKPVPAKTAPTAVAPHAQQTTTQLWPQDKRGSIAETAADWLTKLPQNRSVGRVVTKDEISRLLDGNPSYVQLCESLESKGIKFERSTLAKELLRAMPEGMRNQNNAKAGSSATPIAAQMDGAASTPDTGKKNKGGRPRKDGPLSYSVPHNNNRSTAGGVAYQAPTFSSLADAAREVNQMGIATGFPPGTGSSLASAITGSGSPFQPAVSSPGLGGPSGFNNDGRPPSQSQPPDVKAESVAPEPQRPPADKEEAARKRTFNDLVDLTKGDSDDEAPPRKIQQTFIPPAPVPGMPKPQQPTDDFRKPMDYATFMRQNNGFLNTMSGHGGLHPSAPPRGAQFAFQSRPVPQPNMVPSQPQPQAQPRPKGPTEEQKQHERLRGKMLVEPIMRDRVARKSRYDPRTIARDVLLATGRHPDMRALNSHMNSMQKMLGDHGGVVDGAGNKSDLATIRWDIIDPGEPADEAKRQAKNVAETRGQELATGATSPAADSEETDDADDEGDARAEPFAVKEPTRLPNAVHKERLEDLKKRMLELASEEERANIDDPKVFKQVKNRLRQSEWRARQKRKTLESNNDGDEAQVAEAAAKKPKLGRPPKPRPSDVASASDNNFMLESNITPRDNTEARATPSASQNGTPAPKGSAASPMSTGKPVGYAQFRQLDASGNPIKKKGRPVGWRKSLHSREAQGLTPIKTGTYKPVSAGSRLRQSTGSKPDELVRPKYQVYKCRWEGCTAELDNLERLKTHVVKLHGRPNAEGDFECQWRNCSSAGTHTDANGKVSGGYSGGASFENIESWLKHFNKEHLEQIAWKLGDGPKGGALSDITTDSEAYLSDANKRSVTPIIVPAAELAKNRPPGQPLLESDLPILAKPPVGPGSKELRQATEDFAKLKEQKRAEGVSMGQEGSKLVNAARRRGFLDDEEFEDVISEDDW